jgi:hypothetical protein
MAGPRVTVRVKAWVAVPVLFLAVRVSGYIPAAAFAGVPQIVAVPSPLSANLTPDGSPPALVILGTGSPVVVTVNLNATPKAAVSAELLVKAGPPARATDTGVLAPESPEVVWATTVMLYVVPPARLVTVQAVPVVVVHAA